MDRNSGADLNFKYKVHLVADDKLNEIRSQTASKHFYRLLNALKPFYFIQCYEDHVLDFLDISEIFK